MEVIKTADWVIDMGPRAAAPAAASSGVVHACEAPPHPHLALDLCAYKDPAFREEKEVRYAHIAGRVPGKKPSQLIPLGARAHDGSRLSEPYEILYRRRNGIKVPYVALDWSDKGRVAPLALVGLGAANPESEQNIRAHLGSLGLVTPRIVRSKVLVG